MSVETLPSAVPSATGATDRTSASRVVAREDVGGAIAHVPALDGIRGLAIVLVLFLHFGVAAGFAQRSGTLAGRWIERVLYAGWSGVDLFFVLSGFLITSILLASREQPGYYRRFYARRILRIFPLYFSTLVLGLLILPWVLPAYTHKVVGDSLSGQVWLWTYTLNLAMVFGWIANPGTFAQYWTLAIEEQYYVCWPAIVKTLSARTLLRVCVGVLIGALVLRLVWMAVGLGWEGAYRFTLTRLDGFAAGGLTALLVSDPAWGERLRRIAPAGLAAGLALLAVMALAVPQFYPSEWLVVTFGHSLLSITFALLIVVGVRRPPPPWMSSPTFRLLGKLSYGIYVWHWPLQRWMIYTYATSRAQSPAVGFMQASAFLLVGVGGSVLLGWLSYRIIERPFLNLKDRFAY